MLLLGEANRKKHQKYQRTHAAVSGKKPFCSGNRIWTALLVCFGCLCFVWYSVVLRTLTNSSDDIRDRILTDPPTSVDSHSSKVTKTLSSNDDSITIQFWDSFGCPSEHSPKQTITYNGDSNSVDEILLCKIDPKFAYRSVKITGSGYEADCFGGCSTNSGDYHGSIMVVDGCVDLRSYPRVKRLKLVPSSLTRKQIPDTELQEQLAKQESKATTAKYRIVFSAESSEYFGYQTLANYYGFMNSDQSAATWTRLLTCRERDDLSQMGFTTFQSKRHTFSHRYSPINKPDSITKWFASPDAPKEEVIVVIDPDNWLLKDVTKWVNQVSPGEALGEAAYYAGSTRAQKLWKQMCKHNCDWELDLVGVPYVVHRDDLRKIAPLWRDYSIAIKDLLDYHHNPEHYKQLLQDYSSMGVEWAAEMFGYNMAAAHAGVKHKLVRKMQVRDVDSERRASVLEPTVAMIHMGRAWFPHDYQPAQQWAHTEGKSFRRYGQQVWCKCNFTASTVIPWPVPPEADFVSTKTLTILHNALEEYGPVPVNTQFRKGTENQARYHHQSAD